MVVMDHLFFSPDLCDEEDEDLDDIDEDEEEGGK